MSQLQIRLTAINFSLVYHKHNLSECKIFDNKTKKNKKKNLCKIINTFIKKQSTMA